MAAIQMTKKGGLHWQRPLRDYFRDSLISLRRCRERFRAGVFGAGVHVEALVVQRLFAAFVEGHQNVARRFHVKFDTERVGVGAKAE